MSKQSPANVADVRKVRLGGNSPSLPVRLAPANVADGSKVRLGGNMPAFILRIATVNVAARCASAATARASDRADASIRRL